MFLKRSFQSPEERLDPASTGGATSEAVFVFVCSLSTADMIAAVTADDDDDDDNDDDGIYQLVLS